MGSFVIEGLPQLERRIAAIIDVSDRATMGEIGSALVQEMKSLAPVSEDGSHGMPPGSLKASIDVQAVSDGMVTIVAGGEDYPAARAVEFGAGPHIIRARRTARLKFFWERENRMFVGPVVKHPGTKAQPFFRPPVDALNLLKITRARIVARWNAAA